MKTVTFKIDVKPSSVPNGMIYRTCFRVLDPISSWLSVDGLIRIAVEHGEEWSSFHVFYLDTPPYRRCGALSLLVKPTTWTGCYSYSKMDYRMDTETLRNNQDSRLAILEFKMEEPTNVDPGELVCLSNELGQESIDNLVFQAWFDGRISSIPRMAEEQTTTDRRFLEYAGRGGRGDVRHLNGNLDGAVRFVPEG